MRSTGGVFSTSSYCYANESRFPGEQLAQASGTVVAHFLKGSSLKDGVGLSWRG